MKNTALFKLGGEWRWWALGWLNLARNRRRSLIAGGVLALGSCALLMAGGYMFATFEGLRESTIQGGVGHLQIAAKGAFDDREADLQGISAERLAAVKAHLDAIDEVRLVAPRIQFEGLASSGDITIASIGRGVDIRRERQITLFSPVVEGRNISRKDEPFVAVLGDRLASDLKVKPGDSITLLASTPYQGINASDVTLVGTNRSGVPELDARSIMLPLEAAQILKDVDDLSRLVVALHRTQDTDQVARQIETAFPDLEVRTWYDLFPFYGAVVNLYRGIFGTMGGIILVVVFLSVSNTLMMAIMERVNESGTLRAFGYSRRQVITLFVREGAMMAVLGALAGLLIGTALILLINQMGIQMPPPPGRSVGYPLILNWEASVALGVLVGMSLCGLFAAWLPALRMTRMPITRALAHF
jgi:putative ABC transport system permease protein